MQSPAHILPAIAAAVLVLLIAAAPVRNAAAQAEANDPRQAIALDATERAFVLAEMRTFLKSVEGIVSALASDRVAEAQAPAKKSGMGVMHSVPPTLRKKLPMEFMKMGRATHEGFDALAAEAATLADKTTVLKQLETILNNCTTCHASYRLSGG